MRQEAPALAVAGDDVFLTWALTHPKLTPDKPFSNELRLSRSTNGGNTSSLSNLGKDEEQGSGHSRSTDPGRLAGPGAADGAEAAAPARAQQCRDAAQVAFRNGGRGGCVVRWVWHRFLRWWCGGVATV